MQKKNLILVGIVVVIITIISGFFVYQNYYKKPQIPVVENQNPSPSPTPTPEPTPNPTPTPTQNPVTITTDPATGAKTYTDSKYGFSFQYPSKLASTFASFQSDPKAIVSPKGSKDIDAKGCYQLDIQHMESVGLVGGINFCESSGGDPGAGQLYSSYYYTTLHGQNYITLAYVVHTPNGCGAYQGTENYGKCTDFFNNITSIVLDPIRNSAATLKFTK